LKKLHGIHQMVISGGETTATDDKWEIYNVVKTFQRLMS
jgi:hypothetical protein